MSGKIFVCLLTTLLLITASLAQAQQAKKTPRIRILVSAEGPNIEGFRRGLRDLGYIEGKNILVEYRYHEGQPDRVPSLVAELLQLKVDVLVSTNSSAIRALTQATQTIPIVMITT